MDVDQIRMNSLWFGAGTTIHLAPGGLDLGSYEVRTEDTDLTGDDGIVFGRDTRSGRTISLALQAYVDPQSGQMVRLLDDVEQFQAHWRSDTVRDRSGWVSDLALCLAPGRERVAFGRPRNVAFTPVKNLYSQGAMAGVATFATIDDLFYSTAVSYTLRQYTAPADSGLTAPLVAPLQEVASAAVGERLTLMTIPGTLRTRMVEIEFVGPSTDPWCEVVGVGKVGWRGSLGAGQTLRLRTHPAFRVVTMNGARTMFGRVVGMPLDDFALLPGRNEVRYTANDPGNSSRMTITARGAYTSP